MTLRIPTVGLVPEDLAPKCHVEPQERLRVTVWGCWSLQLNVMLKIKIYSHLVVAARLVALVQVSSASVERDLLNMWSFSSWRNSWDPSHGKSEPIRRLMLEGGCIAFNSFNFMCQLIYSTSLLVLYCCCMSQQLKTTPQKHVIIMCNFGTKMCKKSVIRPSEMAKLQVCNLSKPYRQFRLGSNFYLRPALLFDYVPKITWKCIKIEWSCTSRFWPSIDFITAIAKSEPFQCRHLLLEPCLVAELLIQLIYKQRHDHILVRVASYRKREDE